MVNLTETSYVVQFQQDAKDFDKQFHEHLGEYMRHAMLECETDYDRGKEAVKIVCAAFEVIRKKLNYRINQGE